MKTLFKELSRIVIIGGLSIFGYMTIKKINSGPKEDSIVNNNAICSQFDGKASELPVGLIHDMVNNYRDMNKVSSKAIHLIEDSESVWFDIETLKKFLYHIEFASENDKNSIEAKDLGIRIYYARYPDRDTWKEEGKYYNALDDFYDDPEAEDYGRKHTVIMVPTKKITTDSGYINADFNPLDSDTFINGLKIPNNNRYDSTSEHPMLVLNFIPSKRESINEVPTRAQNHGSLIPPRNPEANELGF